MRKRRTARVMLLDPLGEILLIRFAVPRPEGEFVFWITPGGEIESDESEAQAAAREVMEELGVAVAVSGPIRVQANSFLHEGEMRDNTDFFFVARCAREAPRLLGVCASERLLMKEIRWWSADELEHALDTVIFPGELARWVREASFDAAEPSSGEPGFFHKKAGQCC